MTNGTGIVPSLEARAAAIYAVMNDAAIEVGGHLVAAKAEHPGEFMDWVERCLPFGIDKAERLMAIHRSLRTAPPEVREQLPSAYSTLFHLARLPRPRLVAAIDAGEVTPTTTVRQAEAVVREVNGTPPRDAPVPMPEVQPTPVNDPGLAADLVARELVERFDPDELSGEMTARLRVWLG